MSKPLLVALFMLVLIIVIVGADVLLFRNDLWPRLLSNVGIVLIFAALYLRFLK